MKITQMMPESLKQPLRKLRNLLRGLQYAGRGRYCPVCEHHSRKFGVAGIIPREDAQCMYCGCGERHRFVWLYFTRITHVFSGLRLKMLHIAPEEAFEELFRRQLGNNYITADLNNPKVMVKMDITDIQYPDETFDVIYCSHVLEHVVDDKKAIREFVRVLKLKGWAIIMVPIDADRTIEDLSITEPEDRLARFGDETHVRCYGPDFVERLREAGFVVKLVLPTDFLSRDEILEMGITQAAGEIYVCTK